jgi:uncharacterized protein (TIGR03118 family)
MRFSYLRSVLLAAVVVAVVLVGVAAGVSTAATSNSYLVHNLVSDQAGVADHMDPNLVNAWGLAALPTSPWWVADNGMNVSTLYTADGTAQSLVVSVPNAPTGVVANSTSDFALSMGGKSGPALFIFDTEEGAILGWNLSGVPTQAVVAVPSAGGAVFKGLAIASTGSGERLYATDFHNGRVDVFDGNFAQLNTPGAFVDPGIATGYAPFGIQNIGGAIFVTYAKQDAARHDDVPGQGHGFVDEFDTNGALLQRVATHGQLNSPWGLAAAPASFGRFGGDLLVGNFGDGQINALRQLPSGNYEHAGQLRNTDGKTLTIDGLWSLQFGHGAVKNGPIDTLFFTAGPDGESHGLFGTVRAS